MSADAMEGESCSERRFFEEREQVRELLLQMTQTRPPTPESDVSRDFLAAHCSVTSTLDKYLEQSHLLDPYLREMLAPVVHEIKRVMAERAQTQADAAQGVAFPCQVYRNPQLHKLFQLVYHLCKVRGYKTLVKLLPHEVSDFEPTLQLLQSQDRADHAAWETRYVLLLWLSMLCLVPFDLTTIDSSADTSIVANIVTLCKDYLSDPGATQVAAAVCLSRLLSRPDMEQHYLTQFLNWANRELMAASEGKDTRVLQFKVTGIMLCLAHIAKNSPREQHIEASRIYFATVMKLVAHLTEDNARSDRPSSSTLHRKLSVKLVQRLGLLYLPPKVRSWRYSRGLRSLELNMQSLGLTAGNTVASTPTRLQDASDDDEDDDTFEVVEELEQIVEVLLCGLRDKDTVVRWSAAKGIGRITGRLPYEFADDIVQSVLELFVATEGDGAWHGASLALAELARRGVLLPQRLPDAVECVANALKYDIRKASLQGPATEDEDPGSRVAAVQALVDLSSRPPAELDLNGMEDAVVQTLVRCVHQDYRLDERGDVGSWVRKEAMLGLEKLLLGESTHAQNQHFRLVGAVARTEYGQGVIVDGLSDRKRKIEEISGMSESDPLCYVKFEKPALGYYYFGPKGVGLLHAKRLSMDLGDTCQNSDSSTGFQIPEIADRIKLGEKDELVKSASSMPFARRLSPDLVGTVFGALAKQLAEKLDNMRMTAAREADIPVDANKFMEEVAAGLVISVGGLTESVVKASKSALFEWVRTHLQAKNFGLLNRFSFFLVTLLTRHHQDDRVTIPLMKTMALLLESNLLRFLFEERKTEDGCTSATDFGERLYTALRDEIQKCTAVPKLSAAISVLIGLLPSDPETETKTLRALVLFLGHKFPKVRKLTAEKLYTRLLLHDEIVDEEKYDAVVEILSDTAWDASIFQVRSARNELLELLGMELPSKKTSASPVETKTTTNEGASYKTLIKEMGY
ncbi:Tubulin-specific chaperone D [Phytophthora cinnamomi]|uniref:Tubulin-specific chaperone D n=1 Tax=Phytophthora cinnamomi TaxID=4785 RepID=UPI00355937DA|nr:Tubulin-specific chaperone D [Phytophthora cinnamomi]